MKKEDSNKSTRIFEDLQELEVFTLSNDLENFSDLIVEIFILCREYGEVWDRTMEPMSKSEFYDLVNNYYLQLGNFK